MSAPYIDPLADNGLFVAEPFDAPLYEIVNGQRQELPPKGAYENVLASQLMLRLGTFAQDRSFGRAVNETLFVLRTEPPLNRRPDVAFVSYERWPARRRVPRTNAWDVVPNLAVEVISQSNTADDIPTRVRDYFEAGVEMVWIVFPVESLVYVYESPVAVSVRTRNDRLEGGSVLPGFELPLAMLFDDEPDGDALADTSGE